MDRSVGCPGISGQNAHGPDCSGPCSPLELRRVTGYKRKRPPLNVETTIPLFMQVQEEIKPHMRVGGKE